VAVHVVCVIRHIQALKRGTVLVFKKSEHVHILPGVVSVLLERNIQKIHMNTVIEYQHTI
jgi:hypothetical protein